MNNIEEHITESHQFNAFRFEVQQDQVAYLDGMLGCPICQSPHTWKNDFLQHLKVDHDLNDLVTYINVKYICTTEEGMVLPKKIDIPAILFGDSFIKVDKDSAIEVSVDDGLNVNDLLATNEHEMVGPNEQSTDECLNDKEDLASQKMPEILPKTENEFVVGSESSIDQIAKVDESKCISKAKDVSENVNNIEETVEIRSTISLMAESAVSIRRKGVVNMLYCKLCPFETNRTLHFQRHTETHERNEAITEGYSCGYCHFLHPRRNCVNFHLGK